MPFQLLPMPSKPQKMPSQPQKMSSQPQKMSSQPQKMSSQPQKMSSQPQKMSSQPQKMSSRPQKISSLLVSMPSRLLTIVSFYQLTKKICTACCANLSLVQFKPYSFQIYKLNTPVQILHVVPKVYRLPCKHPELYRHSAEYNG